MRRLCVFATFVSLTFTLPLLAQHGGGHASSGGHGGGFAGHSSFSGGHSSFSAPSSSHVFSGMSSRPGYGVHSASGARPMGSSLARSRTYTPAFRPPRQAFSANRFNSANRLDSRNRSGNGFGNRSGGTRDRDRDRDRHHGFRDRDRGFVGPWRFGYPGWYGYYDPYFYDPYWWWDSSSYDDDQSQDIAQANQMNEQSLEEQRARDNYDGGDDQDVYARSAPSEPQHLELTAPSPPTTLIFRDQHKQEIQNYAIVGRTLWSFSPQRTEKIPLADIDIPATTKVNDDRGVSFKVPGEGQ
jgi:hypothetical protein